MYYLDFLHFLCPFFLHFLKSLHGNLDIMFIESSLSFYSVTSQLFSQDILSTTLDMVHFDCFELATWFLSCSHDNNEFIYYIINPLFSFFQKE